MPKLSIEKELKLVMDHIAKGNMHFAEALLAATLRSKGVQISDPEETAQLCKTIGKGLSAGVSQDVITDVFKIEMQPENRQSRPTLTFQPAVINDKLEEAIKKFELARDIVDNLEKGDADKALEKVKDLVRSPTALPSPQPEGKKPVNEKDAKAYLKNVDAALRAKIDPLAVARAVVEGINPTGITEFAGPWIVQGVGATGRQTGFLISDKDKKFGGQPGEAQQMPMNQAQQELLHNVIQAGNVFEIATPKPRPDGSRHAAEKLSDKKLEELVQDALQQDRDPNAPGIQTAEAKQDASPAPEMPSEVDYESPKPFSVRPTPR